MSRFLCLVDFFNATIKTVIFSEESTDTVKVMGHLEAAVEVQNKLKKQFNESKTETIHLLGNDFHQSILEYIQKEQTDLLAMIAYKKTFMQNLFNLSMTRKMANHTTVPLMYLQGSMELNT